MNRTLRSQMLLLLPETIISNGKRFRSCCSNATLTLDWTLNNSAPLSLKSSTRIAWSSRTSYEWLIRRYWFRTTGTEYGPKTPCLSWTKSWARLTWRSLSKSKSELCLSKQRQRFSCASTHRSLPRSNTLSSMSCATRPRMTNQKTTWPDSVSQSHSNCG